MLLLLCASPALAQAPPAPPAPPASPADLYTAARFDLLDENYDAAVAKLDRALALAPGEPRLVLLKAQALEDGGKRDQAIAFVKGVLEQDPARWGFLRFELAYLYIRAGRTTEALAQLKAAEQLDKQRAITEQVLLRLRAKQYERALAELKRLPVQTAHSKYLAAQAQFYLGNYSASRALIQEGLALKPDPALARNLRSLQEGGRRRQWAERRLRGHFTLALQYNDNVFTDPLQDNPAVIPPRKKDDFALFAKLDLEYRPWQQGGDRLALTGSVLKMTQMELGESSYGGWSLGGYFARDLARWGFRLPYELAYYYEGSSLNRRVQTHSLSPSLYWQMTRVLRTELYGLLQRRIYFTGESNINRWGLGVLHYWLLKGWDRYLRLGYRVDQDIADDQKNGFWYYEISLGGNTRLAERLNLDAGLTFGWYRFDERPEPYLVGDLGPAGATMVRRDRQLRFALQLFYRPKDNWQLALAYFFTDNSSNVTKDVNFDPYEFRQSIVSFTSTWTF